MRVLNIEEATTRRRRAAAQKLAADIVADFAATRENMEAKNKRMLYMLGLRTYQDTFLSRGKTHD